MLTPLQKGIVSRELLKEIRKFPSGVPSRTAIITVTTRLQAFIPTLNRHHTSGILGTLIPQQVKFVVRAPRRSVVKT